jgi:predicted alpha/beta hydrolase
MTRAGSDESFHGAGVRLTGERWPAVAEGALRQHGVVLLLHGGGQTRHSWSGTAQSIAAQGWTAVAVDARGHGDSDWASDGDYSIDALIADLPAVVSAVVPADGERPVLVGVSMGGMTSLVGQGERGDLARAQIARMRDHLAHRYFDAAHAILQATVDGDLPDLDRAIQSLTLSVEKEDPDTRTGTT